jgi:hypothetical protein
MSIIKKEPKSLKWVVIAAFGGFFAVCSLLSCFGPSPFEEDSNTTKTPTTQEESKYDVPEGVTSTDDDDDMGAIVFTAPTGPPVSSSF